MKVAVVGHVEWIDFVPVERVPAQGAIAVVPESWGQAGGRGRRRVGRASRGWPARARS